MTSTTDRALQQLQDQGVTTLAMLRVVMFLHIERSFDDIFAATGVDRSSVRRFMLKYPTLIKKNQHPASGQPGHPPVRLALSAKGHRLIRALRDSTRI